MLCLTRAETLVKRLPNHICNLFVARSQCPGTNFHLAADRCFYISTKAANWYQAKANCSSAGVRGQLTKIDSMTEHDKLRSVITSQDKKKYWIGLYSGTWIWANSKVICQ